MNTASINEQFIAHRSVCALCRSDGPKVCYIGMRLLKLFNQALVQEATSVHFAGTTPLRVQ
jgi:hypothetical protein